MKKLQNLSRTIGPATVLVAVMAGFAGQVRADCGIAANLASRLAVATVPDEVSARPGAEGEASALAATASPDSQSVIGDGSIVGLWKTTFTSGGQITDVGFDQWNSDGTEILNDDPPPQTGNVCLGVYVNAGRSYKLKHPSWTYDANGNLTGTAILREQVTVGSGGNTYSGTYTLDFYDLNGNHLVQYRGELTSTRITVDF